MWEKNNCAGNWWQTCLKTKKRKQWYKLHERIVSSGNKSFSNNKQFCCCCCCCCCCFLSSFWKLFVCYNLQKFCFFYWRVSIIKNNFLFFIIKIFISFFFVSSFCFVFLIGMNYIETHYNKTLNNSVLKSTEQFYRTNKPHYQRYCDW